MRRRLNALRRLAPRTPDPEPEADAPEPSGATPVAWAPEEPGPAEEQEQHAPSAAPAPADAEQAPAAESDQSSTPEPETTVFGAIAEAPPPEEPQTAVHDPVRPPADATVGRPAERGTAGAAPQDAVAAAPLEVLGVQPDGTVLPAPDPSAPAGVEPGPDEPGFRVRGRLRRRLRYLRRVRELGLRDLGGLVFDLHRFGREGDALVAGKLTALSAVDDEIRVLEESLDDRRELVVLREPGLAACPRCAALHGSDANFCPSCGLPFGGAHPAVAAGPPLAAPPVGPSGVTAAHSPLDPHGRPPGPS